MEDIDHTEFIEKWIQNIDAVAYEQISYKDLKLPYIMKKIDRNDKT